MFNTHCKAVQEYSQRNANNMADVVLMVVLSIQQNWLSVGDQLKDVRLERRDSKFLWGNKIKTYDYLMSNKSKMFAQVQAVLNSHKTYNDKAESLDVHNIKMYNLDANSFKLNPNPKTDKAFASNKQKITAYINLCHDYGCEQLWDSWCDMLATKSKRWQDGNHVSEVHYTYLTGE